MKEFRLIIISYTCELKIDIVAHHPYNPTNSILVPTTFNLIHDLPMTWTSQPTSYKPSTTSTLITNLTLMDQQIQTHISMSLARRYSIYKKINFINFISDQIIHNEFLYLILMSINKLKDCKYAKMCIIMQSNIQTILISVEYCKCILVYIVKHQSLQLVMSPNS